MNNFTNSHSSCISIIICTINHHYTYRLCALPTPTVTWTVLPFVIHCPHKAVSLPMTKLLQSSVSQERVTAFRTLTFLLNKTWSPLGFAPPTLLIFCHFQKQTTDKADVFNSFGFPSVRFCGQSLAGVDCQAHQTCQTVTAVTIVGLDLLPVIHDRLAVTD